MKALTDGGERMASSEIDELRAELDKLHQGRGLRRRDILDHVGPRLRSILELDGEPDSDEARRRLRAEIHDAARSLEQEFRYVFVMASALSSDAPTLSERMEVVASKLNRDARTIRRRLRDADVQTAETLLRRADQKHKDPAPFQEGWYLTDFETSLHLDRDRPEFVGIRTIVVTADKLRHVEERMSIPRPPHDEYTIEVAPALGCSVLEVERESVSAWRVRLELDKALEVGQRHVFGTRVTVPSRDYIRPYSVLVPFRQCRTFSTEVHFGTPPAADLAWRIAGVAPVILDDAVPTVDVYDLGADSVARASFSNVYTGLAYGIQWDWA